MGKVSEQAKVTYADRIRDYKQEADQILSREKSILMAIEKDKEEAAKAYKRLTLAEDRLNLASYYLLMNKVSLYLLGIKNEAFINDARKCCYESVIHLKHVVGDLLDEPFSTYEDKLTNIEAFSDDKRYLLLRKIGFTIDSVEEDFGENTKWKWSFVDLEGQYAIVAKNLVNFKSIVGNLDPRIEGYDNRVRFLRLVKDLLNKSADRYRQKYELSTNRIDDFKMAINFLSALRRIHLMLGEPDLAEQAKRKYEVWKTKMDVDEKRQESKAP
jgi:hypothetical protein